MLSEGMSTHRPILVATWEATRMRDRARRTTQRTCSGVDGHWHACGELSLPIALEPGQEHYHVDENEADSEHDPADDHPQGGATQFKRAPVEDRRHDDQDDNRRAAPWMGGTSVGRLRRTRVDASAPDSAEDPVPGDGGEQALQCVTPLRGRRHRNRG